MELIIYFPWAISVIALVWSRVAEKKYALKYDQKTFSLWVMNIKSPSVVSCAATCKMHQMCSYYSYNDNVKLCLIHSNREEDTTLISDSEVRIYEPDCPPHWDLFESNCYFVSQDQKSWHNAKVYCEEQQSMLVEVISENENNFLKGKAEEDIAFYWIGATDIETEGVWIWDNSQTVVTFTNWFPGQPDNNHDNQNCLQLVKKFGYKWDDFPCGRLHAFICEKPIFS
ncbi:COLEC12 [Mytilus edulis]|uniref:COLEC12 n=1 Tax=Mytilus edulis TaxID=6550 RepID=A0A8S3QIS7_MYTED|nr:COLEC12 [Mytilus edulis]